MTSENLDHPKQSLMAEVGTSGLRRFGYQIDEEFDPNLKGLRGIRKYDEMRRNDPDVGAILTAIEMSIRSVDWSVELAGDTDADAEAKEFLESCMDDMSHSWVDFISEVLTMLVFGWAYFEKVYKLRQGKKSGDTASSKYDDGRIGWRKVVLRGQESLKGWAIDENGGIQGMYQWALQGKSERYIDIDRAILFRTKREKNNPEGYSLLRNAYRPYYIKTNVEEIEVISIERDMTGVPVITLPLNATEDDKNAALDILKKLKNDEQAGLVLPRAGEGEHLWWKFELVTSPGAPKVDTDKVVMRNSTAIARSFLAQFLTVGQGRVGSYALVKDFRDLFHLALVGFLDSIAETINRYMIEPLFQLNEFPNITRTPTIAHGKMGQRDLEKFATTLAGLQSIGVPLTDQDLEFIHEEAELPALPDNFWEEKHAQEELDKQKKEENQQAQFDLQKQKVLGGVPDQVPPGNPNNNPAPATAPGIQTVPGELPKEEIAAAQKKAHEEWLQWLWHEESAS